MLIFYILYFAYEILVILLIFQIPTAAHSK